MQIWNVERGQPWNYVYAILQTSDGYLWLGTSDGLVRFDGINFELYTKEKTYQLKSNLIRVIFEDRNGALWIGTDSGGLTYYKDGNFFNYPVTEHDALSKIRAINEDRDGNLWIGSNSEGLTRLRGEKFTTYTTKEGLPQNRVKAIYKDGNGDLRIATDTGIVKFKKPGFFQPSVPEKFLPPHITACLYEKETDELWIGASGGGLFSLKNGMFTTYGIEEGLPNAPITSLFKDSNKTLWIGTDGGGLTRNSKGKFSTLSGGEGLASGSVYSIYEDREGSLWVGTIDGGLHQLRDGKFTTYTYREGLAHDFVHCIIESRAGGLWIGSRGGLNRVKKGTLTATPLIVKKKLIEDEVLCLCEDPEGCLWIGTRRGGLHSFKDGKLTTLTTKDGLADNIIVSVLGDSQGNTWIGTNKGLNRLDKKNRKLKEFTTKAGLSRNRINFIFEDNRGNIRVGTNTGLYYLKDGTFTVCKPAAGFENKQFHCAYEDKEGALWFGTGGGLIRLQGKQAKLYTEQCGLNENYIHSILEDEKGYLWLGGQNGISRVKKKELEDFAAGKIERVRPGSYDERDGMKSRWCNNPGCKTRDGRFWFPTSVGVAVIDPNQIRKSNLPPPLIIEKLIVDGKTININPNTTAKETIIFSPGKKRFEFYYTAVSFINPQKIKFKLKLVGYDSDWIEMGSLRSTTYTGLSPGHYTFKVNACNPDGIWNEQDTSIHFHLKPYFTQTTWFRLLTGLSIMLLGFLLYRSRVRQLRARGEKLSALVSLRTKDLRERNTELEKARRKIQQSKEIIETKNRHITDSMRYAHKIQQAMLPIKEKMSRELKDYFVVYQPKDIVSGDFYWFDVVDNQYFLAVADCTGHGVPGALLSMIGGMMLKEVISEKRIIDPAAVLSHLHRGFRAVLKQEEGEAETYDGMELSLCRIDKKAGKVIFAGAKRPLFYVKNSELLRIKGDRKSIGGRQKEEKRFFTNHEIEISGGKENEIMFYLTTDGFADQNNPQNKKYGSRKLEKFLGDHAHLSTARQEEALLRELREHMGDEEQRDDITIIGIKVRFPMQR